MSEIPNLNMNNELPLIELKELAGNGLPSLNPMQEALLPYVGGFENMWWAVWFVTLAVVIYYAWKHGVDEDK